MLYDLRQQLDVDRLRTRLSSDIRKGAVVDYTSKQLRTSNQNRYLHLVIGVVAMDTGNDIAYTKQEYFKRLVNPAIFVIQKDDPFLGTVEVLRSSAEVTAEEMRTAIDRFKRWAAENGIYIPEPEDQERLRQIEIEMGRMANWL